MPSGKTLLITGAGSVEYSWEPVKYVLRNIHPGTMPESNPEFVFAHIIFMLRWLYSVKKEEKNGSNDYQLKFNEIKTQYDKLKKSIAKELLKAQRSNGIKLRTEIEDIKRRFLTDETVIITTNWDLTIKKFAEDNHHKLHYLHGNIEAPDSLFLPTEMTEDEYHEKIIKKAARKRIKDIIDCFKDVRALVLYGIGLSPLDAELGVVLQDLFHGEKTPEKIVIIDKEPCLVVERARFIWRKWALKNDVRWEVFCPYSLKEEN